MEIYQLIYFQQVCENKSFKKAADAMHVTSPTITIALRKLEQEFGIPFYNRNKRDFELTPAGKEFLELSRKVTDAANILTSRMHELKNDITETIRIGVPRGETQLAEAIYSLSVKYPNVNVIIMQSSNDELASQLSRSILDCCILSRSSLTDQMDYKFYSETEWKLCFPSWYGFEQDDVINLSDLNGYIAYLPQNDSCVSESISSLLRESGANISVQIVFCPMPTAIYNKSSIRNMAIIPPYVSLNPDMVTCFADPPINIEMVLAWSCTNHLSKVKKELIRELTSNSI